MDLKGSLVDSNIRIYPTTFLLNFLDTLSEDSTPINLLRLVKGNDFKGKHDLNIKHFKSPVGQLTDKDIKNIERIRIVISDNNGRVNINDETDKKSEDIVNLTDTSIKNKNETSVENVLTNQKESKTNDGPYLTTSDIDWLYMHLQNKRNNGEKDVPHLHILLKGCKIELPPNKIIKRNPILEARCVKLRAQQEAREYRKMTKGVDNVRMRFPEDSISYQLKQVNRQLIAIGQFILSIFAGFLFGFKGVEWMIGPLDFGFRLLLGVMCALVIALAEIYFLAKKLNEELNIPQTVQLGGPPVFANESPNIRNGSSSIKNKDHQD